MSPGGVTAIGGAGPLRPLAEEAQAVATEGAEEGEAAARRQHLHQAPESAPAGERDDGIGRMPVAGGALRREEGIPGPRPGGPCSRIVRDRRPQILDPRIVPVEEGRGARLDHLPAAGRAADDAGDPGAEHHADVDGVRPGAAGGPFDQESLPAPQLELRGQRAVHRDQVQHEGGRLLERHSLRDRQELRGLHAVERAQRAAGRLEPLDLEAGVHGVLGDLRIEHAVGGREVDRQLPGREQPLPLDLPPAQDDAADGAAAEDVVRLPVPFEGRGGIGQKGVQDVVRRSGEQVLDDDFVRLRIARRRLDDPLQGLLRLAVHRPA